MGHPGSSLQILRFTLRQPEGFSGVQEFAPDVGTVVQSHPDMSRRPKRRYWFRFCRQRQVQQRGDLFVPALFKKLWSKLLMASAVEAIAEKQKDKKFEPATA